MEHTMTSIYGSSQSIRKRTKKAGAKPSSSYKDIMLHATRKKHPFFISRSSRHRADIEIESAVMAIAAAGGFEFDMTEHMDEVQNLVANPDKIDLSPVPPAAFAFPEPLDKEGSRLALVTRGMIGQVILFNSKAPSISLLPAVFDYESLKQLLSDAKQDNEQFDDAIRQMATAQMNNIAPGAIDTPQGQQQLHFMMTQLSSISALAYGKQAKPGLDMETHLHDAVYGELPAPQPENFEGVITALAAAHVMRRRNKDYSTPQYLNSNSIDRGWMEG